MVAEPLRGALPGYVWDVRLRGGRYRETLPDGRLGRIVSQREIVGNLRTIHDASAARYAGLAAEAVNGQISPAEFQRAMMGELKALYNGSAALARGGWSQMDAAAWGRNGQILRGEYGYLAGFAQDLADGKLTEAQAMARAALYAGKAYSRFWAEDLLQKQVSGQFHEERWLDTADERECADCAALARRGWVSLGTLPNPGDGTTECLGACRCEKGYR